MDIFTTYLTRVVPVPIKPANLKVKALLKDAGAGKLKEDLDHLENHDYYFIEQKSAGQPGKGKEKNQKAHIEDEDLNPNKDSSNKPDTDNCITVDKDGTKHLDLYV